MDQGGLDVGVVFGEAFENHRIGTFAVEFDLAVGAPDDG
jgi:hypothetical protein